jgi:CheY-like chemotaxis protein
MSYTVLLLGGDVNPRCSLNVAFRNAAPHIRLCIIPGVEEGRARMAGAGVYANRETYPVPQVILMDLDTTETAGLELLEWRKAKPDLKRIPFMILTSPGKSFGADEAYARGANSCLLKHADERAMHNLARGIGAYAMLLKGNAGVFGAPGADSGADSAEARRHPDLPFPGASGRPSGPLLPHRHFVTRLENGAGGRLAE